jgi:sec-independent protein translocase protein TatB
MFDIGFWELALIGVVALIVIGPEKLPAVARTMGYWIGKTRRFVASVQEDLNREIGKADELKRLLEEQSKIKEIHEIIEHTVDETHKRVSVGAQLHQPQSIPDSTENDAGDHGRLPASSLDQGDATTNPTTNATPSDKANTADSVNEQAK